MTIRYDVSMTTTAVLTPDQARRAEARNLSRLNKLERYLIAAEMSQRPNPTYVAKLREQITTLIAGRCRVCHRTLTDPTSVAAGIGPECAVR